MRLTLLTLAALAAQLASARVAVTDSSMQTLNNFCGTEHSASEIASLQSTLLASNISNSGDDIVVPTYFHIISKGKDGIIPENTVRQQLATLNDAFAPHHIQFDLKYVSRTDESAYKDKYHMHRVLRRGDYATLNVWFVRELLPLGLAGLTTLPVKQKYGAIFDDDGVTVKWDTMPDSKKGLKGNCAVHETGHWLGLLHTFGKDCKADADQIDDTPVQNGPDYECAVGRDSCPEQPGLDPIHNYMGYSGDSCQNEFTPGQVERMHKTWHAIRLNNA